MRSFVTVYQIQASRENSRLLPMISWWGLAFQEIQRHWRQEQANRICCAPQDWAQNWDLHFHLCSSGLLSHRAVSDSTRPWEHILGKEAQSFQAKGTDKEGEGRTWNVMKSAIVVHERQGKGRGHLKDLTIQDRRLPMTSLRKYSWNWNPKGKWERIGGRKER